MIIHTYPLILKKRMNPKPQKSIIILQLNRVKINYLLMLFLIFNIIPLHAQTDLPESTYVELTVVTYNINHGKGVDDLYSSIRIARTLEQYEPDLIALQEVDMGTNRVNQDLQIEIIAKHLEMFYLFGKTINRIGGEYGNAILSKYPIISSQNSDISPDNTSEKRRLLRATVDLGFRTLKFYSTKFGIMDEEKKYNSQRIGKFMKRMDPDDPVIIGGDFGVKPFSPLLNSLMNNLIDLGTKFNSSTATYPTTLMSRRLDYILVNKYVEPMEYYIPIDTLSTISSIHLPIVAKVRISP